jgi:serine/threonine protein phosphatase PrpC
MSDVGLVRTLNEDAWVARPEIGLWAVADGMGGHAKGDVASRAIIDALSGLPRPVDAPRHLRTAEDAVRAVHLRLRKLAGPGGVIGSTVALLLTFDGHFAVAWAGDSRVYRLRDGRLEQLSHDHSLVQELVDRGALAPEAAKDHPFRNQITRAVGSGTELHLDHEQGRLEAGDVFLLCTDGLTTHVGEARIAACLAGRAPEAAVRDLVDAALAEGGTDNVTVVVVALDEDPERTHRNG